jgi:hypothetical protein
MNNNRTALQAQLETLKFIRHADIAETYMRQRQERRNRKPSFANLRVGELGRFYVDTYGRTLPDDDAGRDESLVVAHHIFHGGTIERRFPTWCSLWTPWASADEIDDIIVRVISHPQRWTADELGRRIGLTDEVRTRLMIRTIGAIDCSKAERAARRTVRDAAAHKARRASLAMGREQPMTDKPWEAAGVSRATWFRRKKSEAETVRLKPSAIDSYCTVDSFKSHDDAAPHPALKAETASPPIDRDAEARREASLTWLDEIVRLGDSRNAAEWAALHAKMTAFERGGRACRRLLN